MWQSGKRKAIIIMTSSGKAKPAPLSTGGDLVPVVRENPDVTPPVTRYLPTLKNPAWECRKNGPRLFLSRSPKQRRHNSRSWTYCRQSCLLIIGTEAQSQTGRQKPKRTATGIPSPNFSGKSVRWHRLRRKFGSRPKSARPPEKGNRLRNNS